MDEVRARARAAARAERRRSTCRLAGPEDAGAFAQALIAGLRDARVDGGLGGRPRGAAGVELLPRVLGQREPAAAGCVYIRPPAAWLGLAGTVPELRRRGGQGAIMAARIREAVAAGLHGDRYRDGRARDRPAERFVLEHHALRLQGGLRAAQPRLAAERRGRVASGLRPRRSSRGPAGCRRRRAGRGHHSSGTMPGTPSGSAMTTAAR